MTVTRHQAHLAVVDPGQQAIAVELDLADPVFALRRLIGDGAKLRRLPLRQFPAFRPRRGRVFFPRRPCRLHLAVFGKLRTVRLSGLRRGSCVFDSLGIGAGTFVFVVAFEQQPVVRLAARAGLRPQAHQVKTAIQPLAVQHEGQLALPHASVRVVERLPCAAVPRLDGPGAVLSIRNGALEAGVVDRVVFHVRCDVLNRRIERRSLAHRPTPQHAAVLQPEVPVQAGAMRLVLLHHEHRRVVGGAGLAGRGLGGHREVALRPVGRDRGVTLGCLTGRAGARHRSCSYRSGQTLGTIGGKLGLPPVRAASITRMRNLSRRMRENFFTSPPRSTLRQSARCDQVCPPASSAAVPDTANRRWPVGHRRRRADG